MANSIKYSTNSESLALKKGNFYIGTGDVAKGPTSSTGFYKATTPPEGGYRIYIYNTSVSGNIAYHTAANDSELISFTSDLAGQSYTTVDECLTYYATQTDKVCFNKEYENITTDGLVLNLDAGFTPSYPTSGTTWYDISLSGNNGTLINGPTYSGGSIVFDGSDDYGDFGNGSSISFGQNKSFTIEVIFKTPNFSQDVGTLIARRNADNSTSTDYMIFYQNNQLNFGTGEASDDGAWIRSNDFNFNNQIMFATMVLNSTGSQTGTKQIYKDGKLTANVSYAVKAPSTTNNTYIGKYNGLGGYFNGNIYSTKIYNRALSSSEVLQNYQSTFTRFLGENIVGNGLALYLDAGYYPSYSGTGTNWADISGNRNNGTLTNGPTFNSGDGGSIVFDGADDYVIGNISPSVFSGASTICCWFKRDLMTEWSGLFSNNVNSVSSAILTFINNTNIIGTNQAGINADYIGIDLGNDYLNEWIYCVLVYNGSTIGSGVNVYAYKKGNLLTSSGSLYWNLTTNSQYYVGRHWADVVQVHDGNIPIVQVYNRALSASEVLQNYNAQKGRFGL